MDKTIRIFRIALVLCVTILSVVMFVMLDDNTVKYDCSMLIGGWHPDVSIDIQKKCRARMNK